MSKPESRSEFELRVQKQREVQEPDSKHLLPLVSAADVGRSGWATVRFDKHIADMLRDHARERALEVSKYKHSNYRNHLLGIACEVAVATATRGEIDTRILDDYEGDTGVDVIAPSKWGDGHDLLQVKGCRNTSQPEREITLEEVEKAGVYFLACTKNPEARVNIVGYIRRPALESMNKVYGKNAYLLRPDILSTVEPREYLPDDVREVMQK